MTLSPAELSRAAEIRPQVSDSTHTLFAAQIVLLQDIRALLTESVERRAEGSAPPLENPWRETVRELYDTLHADRPVLATKYLIARIEARHPEYFTEAEGSSEPKTPLDLLAQAISAVTTARDATTQGFADDHCANALRELDLALKWEKRAGDRLWCDYSNLMRRKADGQPR